MVRVIEPLTKIAKGMEALENRWQQLCLSSDEDCNILVYEQALEKSFKDKKSIIGKVHIECSINKEVFYGLQWQKYGNPLNLLR